MRIRRGALLRWAAVTGAVCFFFVGAASAAKPSFQDFDTFLVEGYSQMAEGGHSADDPRASYFHQRAALAARGGRLLPAELDKQVLDSGALREANFARRQLLHRLDAGARLRQPLLAAIAQVNFDCWVAPVPKGGGSPKGDECRRRFYFAFAGLAPGGSDLPPEAIPTEDTGPPGPIIAASASDLAPPQPPATRQLIVTPATNASSTSSAGRSKGVGLASASGPETLYSPTDRRSLARLIQRLMNQTECDRKVGKCVPLGFTGPSADLLIRDLRDSGPDGNGASGGDSVAGSAVGGGDEGNGRNKGSVHGNGHGKGPG